MFGLDLGLSLLLLACLACVCVFEFINGFHDTANAVATVIYTNTLKPRVAVIFSGILNAIGVLLGGTAVATGIISMLPVETLVDQSINHSLGMVGAILLTAIFWNFGTWYLGIPASSTHTLVGSILGCGIAYTLISTDGQAAVNWHKASEVGLSLLVSPLFGFLLALLIMSILKFFVPKDRELFAAPKGETPPPWWIRIILVLTCGLVSYSHGSNDGQKGIGLMMLVLIGLVPLQFALSNKYDDVAVEKELTQLVSAYDQALEGDSDISALRSENLAKQISEVRALLEQTTGENSVPLNRFEVRRHVLLVKDSLNKLIAKKELPASTAKPILDQLKSFKSITDYSPVWVVGLIALSLGLGTMIGWKRIVVTIGEKIGKTHLTYAQGASAEIVAASTIAASTYLGLPVSTTQVLSSGIAGSMYASGGLANLERKMITKIFLAWVLTFPVCLTMSGTIFLIIRGMLP